MTWVGFDLDGSARDLTYHEREDQLAVLTAFLLCIEIAAMTGAAFMKLGRAPTTVMTFILNFLFACTESIYREFVLS
jgi:hypothetical protein